MGHRLLISLSIVAGAIAPLTGCAAPAGVGAPAGPIAMGIQARVVQAAGTSPWNLTQIHRSGFRLQSGAGRPVVVAVLDTGVDPRQPDLAGRIYPNIDVVGRDVYTADGRGIDYTGVDGNGHGTHVSGIVTQVSAGTDVRVLPIKVIPNSGVGDDHLLSTGIEKALAWRDPADPSVRVKIMNLSVSSPQISERLKRAIRAATQEGVLVVGASGNSGRAVEFPALMPEVLSVGATTPEEHVADYSSFGDAVDIAAPGGDDFSPIHSAWPSYLTATDIGAGVTEAHTDAGLVGTSMAAPHVSGTAAVLWALRPHLNATQVRSALLAMADDRGAQGPDPYFGFGLLNFQRAYSGDRHDAR
jgi:subtilisin family serine protease